MGVTVISSSPVAAQAASADISATSAGEGGGLDFAALLGQQIISLAGNTTSDSTLGKSDAGLTESAASILGKEDDKEILPGLQEAGPSDVAIYLVPQLEQRVVAPPQIGANLTPLKQAAVNEIGTPSSAREEASALLNARDNRGTGTAGIASPFSLATSSSSTGAAIAKTDATANLAAELSGNTEQTSFASVLNAQTGNPSSAPAQKESPITVTTPLQDKQWPQSFSERVVWMAKNEQQVAHININPPQLGPIQITLNLSGDQATAIFASPHAEVRQAIQDAMPQLREMLSSAGVSLGQTNVGAQTPQQNREAPEQFANGARFSGETAILSPDGNSGSATSGMVIQRGRGLVDLFA